MIHLQLFRPEPPLLETSKLIPNLGQQSIEAHGPLGHRCDVGKRSLPDLVL